IYLGQKKWELGITKELYGQKSLIADLLFNYLLYPLDIFIRFMKSKSCINLVDRVPGYPFVNHKIMPMMYKFVLPDFDLVVFLHGDEKKLFARKSKRSVKSMIKDNYTWNKVFKLLGQHKLKIYTVEKDINHVCKIILDEIQKDDKFMHLKLISPDF
ncbi:MAG: hypothetical protein K8R68_02785, partial [Bacteroidales bacterium]|nr:hypothetical protein [Bacteroidales bacterium]